MKTKSLLLSMCIIAVSTLVSNAQTDMTYKIVNPSFEDNVDAMATGWSFEGGCDTYVWNVVNTDGDDTKDGDNICGLWNPRFGDVAVTQEITDLENGTYQVTADFTVGVNNATPGQRLTTQRIFANNNSVLYGAEGDYTADNINVLTSTLGESITYAGYAVSTAENGPFETCTVETKVTDGILMFGVKTNGLDSQYGFSFPDAAEDGWGWFKMDNFTLTFLGGSTAIDNASITKDFTAFTNNGFITVKGADTYKIYDLTGHTVPANRQLKPGIYLVKANTMVKKVLVK